jgi:hypothetical protein
MVTRGREADPYRRVLLAAAAVISAEAGHAAIAVARLLRFHTTSHRVGFGVSALAVLLPSSFMAVVGWRARRPAWIMWFGAYPPMLAALVTGGNLTVGGWAVWAILILGVLVWLLAVRALITPQPWLRP